MSAGGGPDIVGLIAVAVLVVGVHLPLAFIRAGSVLGHRADRVRKGSAVRAVR